MMRGVNAGGILLFKQVGEIALTITGAQVLGAAGLLGGAVLLAKKSKQSGKSTSSNKPSWINEGMLDPNKSAQQNAKNILDRKHGAGKWKYGPRSEYNQIVKWIERFVRYYKGW